MWPYVCADVGFAKETQQELFPMLDPDCSAGQLPARPTRSAPRLDGPSEITYLQEVPCPTILIAANQGYTCVCIKVTWVSVADIIPWPSRGPAPACVNFLSNPHCRPFVAEIAYLFPHVSEELTRDRSFASSRVDSSLLVL